MSMKRRNVRVTLLFLMTTVVGVVGGTAVSAALSGEPNPLPADFKRPTAAELRVKAGTERVVVTAEHPDGGLDWGLEFSESETGGLCQAVNRVSGSKLVVVDERGQAHERRAPSEAACADFPRGTTDREHVNTGIVAQYGALAFYGVVDGHVGGVSLVHPDGTQHPVPVSADGAFLAVRRGAADRALDYTLQVRLRDGGVVTYY